MFPFAGFLLSFLSFYRNFRYNGTIKSVTIGAMT